MANSILEKLPIGGSRGKTPTKRSINFAEMGIQKTNYTSTIIVLIVLVIAAAVLSKFFIIDRFQEVADEEAATAELQAQLNQANAKIESFGDLTDTYAQYTYKDMQDSEVTLADRTQVMDLIDTVIFDRCTVGSWELNGNELTINITVKGNNMKMVNMLADELGDDPRVAYSTSPFSRAYEITVAGKENEPEQETITVGRIKATLKKKEVIKG
ncbi:MAG: hypothetical protein IIY94_08535 [Oscillospiraceae bacterium]|nr:hypothetical protein [Oscillospiraceae bacterium]